MKNKNRQQKRLKKRLRQEETTVLRLQEECARYRGEAERISKKFDEIGKNFRVIDDVGGVKCVEWTLDPKPYGIYVSGCNNPDDEMIREAITRHLVEDLLKEGAVQFIGSNMRDDPLSPPTLGAKLYVVPWHTMPHTPMRIRIQE